MTISYNISFLITYKLNYLNNIFLQLLSSFQYVVDVLGDISDFFVTGDDDCYVNFPSIYDYFASDTNQKKKVIHCGFSYDIDAKPSR